MSATHPAWADGEHVFKVPGNRARVKTTWRRDAEELLERLQACTTVPLEMYRDGTGWSVAPVQPYDDGQDA